MKKLSLNKSNFAGAEVLTRAQLKKVIGGGGGNDDGSWEGDPCLGKVGEERRVCCFNVCMAGWDENTHTEAENTQKVTQCDNTCS